MIIFRSSHRILFRYDPLEFSHMILAGSVRISTLEDCRNSKHEAARDEGEGTKTITSLPGTNYPNSQELAKLFGVNPAGIKVSKNAVALVGEHAVHRSEHLENAFVFCTSAIENDISMKTRFGNGCLKIKDPILFFELVDKYLRQRVAPGRLSACIVDDVEYVPRTDNYRDHSTKHSAFLKPHGGNKHFEIESEVRAIWIPKGFKIKPEILTISEVLGLLELLPDVGQHEFE